MASLDYLEGRKFCVVFVKVLDDEKQRVQCKCLHGRANVEGNKLKVVNEKGEGFTVPNTALNNIFPNDGTEMLQDAEYFVMVKVDKNIDLSDPGSETTIDVTPE